MFFYNLSVRAYGLAVQIASVFNPKAKKWVLGRRNFFDKLPKITDQRVIWFHCASLGEFEQGRPIIEAWKKEHPSQFLLVTFFSPSGYEVRKNYEQADYCCYLPLDTPSNAKQFISHFKPEKAFFVKYEFWLNYIHQAEQAKCELYSISTLLRKNHRFFKWYGGNFRKALLHFNHFFVQDENTRELLNSISISKVTVVGDTRYDRVFDRVKEQNTNVLLENWIEPNDTVLVIGSSWKEDEEVLLPVLHSSNQFDKIILAPHEVSTSNVARITSMLKIPYTTYTESEKTTVISKEAPLLILDCIGVLADAYQYGTIAYVGGAFKTGLHNILEPATFGLPVIFGPHHVKFPEAQQFIAAGIGTSIGNSNELQVAFENNLNDLQHLNPKVKEFIATRVGAREKIMDWFSAELV
jgi:3-deoxy-D-manno-octulosonic-acid transferase